MGINSVVKRLLVALLVWMAALGVVSVDSANAAPTVLSTPPSYLAAASTPSETDFVTQLEREILPQIEKIFNVEQWEKFQANIADGMSFRKAFKSLMLSPEQKAQVKTVLSSATKKDALASLSPEQKKKLFLKKKEMFMPTAEEVTEKIEASFKDKGLELPAAVKEKIDAGLKRKDSFIPSPGVITEKIEAGMSAIQKQLEN